MFYQLIKSYNLLGKRISETTVMGFIPLDYLLHFTLGFVLTIIFALFFKNWKKTFWAIGSLTIGKEILDLRVVLRWGLYREPFIDISLTLLGIGAAYFFLTKFFKAKIITGRHS